jgi:hypothetical protein
LGFMVDGRLRTGILDKKRLTRKNGLKKTSLRWMVAKSCTTLNGWTPINNGINNLSTGAGFLPSTVWNRIDDWQYNIIWAYNPTLTYGCFAMGGVGQNRKAGTCRPLFCPCWVYL